MTRLTAACGDLGGWLFSWLARVRSTVKVTSTVTWGWSRPRLASSVCPPPRSRSRSRGPVLLRAAGLPPLRDDAPGRRAPKRGALPPLSSALERAEAEEALVNDFSAGSSRDRYRSMWKTITTALGRWGLSPFPPSKERLKALGSALKAGSYASAKHYLYHYRQRCAQEQYPFSSSLGKLFADVVRSCERGVGAPVEALPLPLLRLHELDLRADAPWVRGGPVGPACALVAGAWFLTREVELSTSRASLVSLERDSEGLEVVRWFLPASKTDQETRGTSRACLLYTSPSPRDLSTSRMPSSA